MRNITGLGTLLLDYSRNAKVVTLASVGLISVCVGLIGLLRDRMITQTYGIGIEADTFYIGLAIPMYLAGILNGLTQTSAMPSFAKLLHNGDGVVRAQFAGALLLLNIGLAVAVSVGMMLWVALGAPGLEVTTPHQLAVVEGMSIGLCLLTAFSSLFVTMLQARGYVKLITAVNGLPSLVCMLYLWGWGGEVSGALWAFLGGYLLLTLLTAVILMRHDGMRLPRRDGEWRPTFRLVFKQYGVLAIGIVFFSANLTIDQVMSTHFGEGQLTAFTLGTRVPLFLAGLVSTAIMAVLLHEFSHVVARKDYERLVTLVRRYERLFFFGVLAAVVPLAVVSTTLLEVLFGVAPGSELDLAGAVFAVSLFHLPFFAAGSVYTRALSALHENKPITYLSLVGCVVNIFMNLVLGYFWGIVGIALSTTAVYAVTAIVLRRYLWRYAAIYLTEAGEKP